ncbi:MAG: hypothetical protein ACRC92_14595 [Peptostreptococcaceae bacterium]
MLVIFLDRAGEYSYDDLRFMSNSDESEFLPKELLTKPIKNHIYTTSDTSFFDFDYMDIFDDVVLVRTKTKEFLSARYILNKNPGHKAIRRVHNIAKMFWSTYFDNKFLKYNSNEMNDILEEIHNVSKGEM